MGFDYKCGWFNDKKLEIVFWLAFALNILWLFGIAFISLN